MTTRLKVTLVLSGAMLFFSNISNAQVLIKPTGVATGDNSIVTNDNEIVITQNGNEFTLDVGTDGDLIFLRDGTASSGTEVMRITDNTGLVGIGTNDPKRRLHVSNGLSGAEPQFNATAVFENDGPAYLHLLTPDTNPSGVLFGNPTNSLAGSIMYNLSGSAGTVLNGLQFRTNGNVTRMVIDDIGNVGIGITTPDQKLHVQRGSAGAVDAFDQSIAVFERNTGGSISILTPDGTAKGLVFGETSNNLAGAIFYDSQAPDGLDFRTNGNVTRMVIDDIGNVGIGTTNPQAELDVNGNIQLRGDQLKFFTGGNSLANLFIGDVAGDSVTTSCCNTIVGTSAGGAITSGNSNTLIGNRAGNILEGAESVMIGTLAGSSTTTGLGNVFIGAQSGENNETGLDNVGLGYLAGPSTAALTQSASIGAFAASNASSKMQLGSSTTTLSTTGGYTIVSDGRFKKEVKNDIKGLDFIMKLNPVSYRFDY